MILRRKKRIHSSLNWLPAAIIFNFEETICLIQFSFCISQPSKEVPLSHFEITVGQWQGDGWVFEIQTRTGFRFDPAFC